MTALTHGFQSKRHVYKLCSCTHFLIPPLFFQWLWQTFPQTSLKCALTLQSRITDPWYLLPPPLTHFFLTRVLLMIPWTQHPSTLFPNWRLGITTWACLLCYDSPLHTRETGCHRPYIFAFIFEVVIIRCDKMAHDRGIAHMICTRAWITWCHMITSHVRTWPWDSSTIRSSGHMLTYDWLEHSWAIAYY